MTAVEGVVRAWHEAEGWGVVECAQAPGGCWVHFSAVAVPGFRTLSVGQAVELEVEAAEQDGYAFRAVRVWPRGMQPHEPPGEGPSTAYRSTLSISFDPPEPDGD
jgi:cold shock protein